MRKPLLQRTHNLNSYFICLSCVAFLNIPSLFALTIPKDSIINIISQLYTENLDTEESKEIVLHSLQQEVLAIDYELSEENMLRFAIDFGKKLNENNQSYLSLEVFKKAIRWVETNQNDYEANQLQIYQLYNLIGITYKNLGYYNEAVENYLKAFRIAKEKDWEVGLAKSYNNLGTLYFEEGDLERAEELTQESIKINEKLDDKIDLLINYSNLASIYNSLKKYDDALLYYHKALKLLPFNDYYRNAVLYTNISQAYKNKLQYTDADSYMEKAISLMDKINNEPLNLQILLNKAEIDAMTNRKEEAMHFITEGEIKIGKINLPYITAEAYRQISEIYELLEDTTTAFTYLNKYVHIADSIHQVDNKEKLLKLLSMYEFESLELQNIRLKQLSQIKELTIEKQKYILLFTILIAFLSFIFLLIIFRKVKSEKEKNALIAEQKEKMLIQEKILFEKNISDLQGQIDFKNRQLTSYTLNIAKANEFHQEMIQKLEAIRKTTNSETTRKELNQVAKQILQYGMNNFDEEFKLYFENVHPQFYKNLLETHPALTPNDLRLCAFLKLGLSTKEIASLTFREIRSVESSRNRLRKKLDIQSEESLQLYLSKF